MVPRRIASLGTSDRFICDSGGGKRPTITERAWLTVGDETGLTAYLQPYQSSAPPKSHPVVSAVTKAFIKGKTDPVLLLVHYATLITEDHDSEEAESLLTTMDMGNHGVIINGIHPSSSKCGITVEGEFLPFEYDDDAVFFRISKPTEEELSIYKVFELNSKLPSEVCKVRRKSGNRRPEVTYKTKFQALPISELRKRFACLPEDTVRKTLENTTQYYLDVLEETRDTPQRHFRKRFKALEHNRQHETVATDFTFFSSKTSQGHKGGQFFSGVKSKKWAFYPLRQEGHNISALQDYIREHGPPDTILGDNAKSQMGAAWTAELRKYMIKGRTTEPRHSHQNPAEPEWGRLSKMIQNCLRMFKAPPELANWCALHCCQVNNHTSRRSLQYKTPVEVATGRTPDISQFRFHFYEPLWYFEPRMKTPKPNMLKARFLANAESCGDLMTYYILTEPADGQQRQVLMRSVVKTRRKRIGYEDEYVNENPDAESFTLSLTESHAVAQQPFASTTDVPVLVAGEKFADSFANTTSTGETEAESAEQLDYTDDEEDQLPPELSATTDAETHAAVVSTTPLDEPSYFRKILDHRWADGVLIFTVQYITDANNTYTLETTWRTLKEDEPVSCAKYIREYISEPRRGDRPLNNWAKEVLKSHGNTVRRMKSVDPQWRSKHEDKNTALRRAVKRVRKVARKRLSKNSHNAKKKREKFGIRIPNTIQEALQFDKEAGNNLWAEAIKKEMDNLDRLSVFKYHPSTKTFDIADGWQKAPLRMIFDIKSEDRRYKARLVVGGHKVDSSMYNTYSSQVDTLSVLLLFLICKHQRLSLITADVSTAFPTAPTNEKVWCVAGPEFGDRQGSMIEIQRAMYGLAGSARAFADFLADTIRRLGFTPSRADPDLWIKKRQDEEGYDYIATHVDDLIVVAKQPQEYISLIEQEFSLRNIESEPSYYLGASLKRIQDGRVLMNSENYIKESIRKYETKYGLVLKKENIPMKTDCHPELDESPLLDEAKHKEYQHLIGLGQWMILTGRIDITYAISSLARFSAGPREGHLQMARQILGYLKKFPKKGILMDPQSPNITELQGDTKDSFEEFGHQYQYFQEELDPLFPAPTIKELPINIFCDSDHAHDKVTGRSITGIIAFVGSTPVYWKSKRQTSVHTSTFGAEFTALKTAVEVAITLRYHLRAMGVSITKPTAIFVDNKSVCINATNPASTLNKKAVALAYHFVRQHQAGKVIDISYIKSEDNYADLLTKPLNSTAFRSLLFEFMSN